MHRSVRAGLERGRRLAGNSIKLLSRAGIALQGLGKYFCA
jgi:hypothetical protein